MKAKGGSHEDQDKRKSRSAYCVAAPAVKTKIARAERRVPVRNKRPPQKGGFCFLLQPRVLGFGLLQDWEVGVGVFPQCEEVLIRGFRFRRIPGHRIGATDLQVR
jgi:hypothetical protein